VSSAAAFIIPDKVTVTIREISLSQHYGKLYSLKLDGTNCQYMNGQKINKQLTKQQ